MKARLTKAQVQMLLEGKKLTYGRRSITIPKEGEIPYQLKLWLYCDKNQKTFNVLVDTNLLAIYFERKGAEQE